MTIGDTITADRQLEVDGTLFPYLLLDGDDELAGTIWVQDFTTRPAASIRDSDQAISGIEGVAAGSDLRGDRRFTIPFLIDALTETDAYALADVLTALWEPSARDVWIAHRTGGVVRCFYGRVRGIELDESLAAQGVLSGQARFVATDPRIFAPPVAASSGTVTVTTDSRPWPWTATFTGDSFDSVSVTVDSDAFDLELSGLGVEGSQVFTIGTFPRRTASVAGREVAADLSAQWGDLAADTEQTITASTDNVGVTPTITYYPVIG